MRVRRNYYVAAAIAVAVLSAVWKLSLGPRLTIRVPRDAVFTWNYIGTQTNADPKTGLIPERDILSTYDRIIRVVDAADWPRSVVVRDQYTARDIETRAINFEYISDERVDPHTGAWADGPHKGDIVLFPRDVQKRAYTMRSNYVESVPLTFSGVHDIGDLQTFQFSYHGPMDLTSAFSGTPESPGVKILPGQAIRCADGQFYYRIWIEPRTGSTVKVEEGCPSGDFIYDIATGEKLAAVDRWSGVTTGGDLAARITEIYRDRLRYMWLTVYVPLVLLGISAGILAIGYSRRDSALPA
jgi:hypothetical protein